MSELVLTPGAASLADPERVWREGVAARRAASAHPAIDAAAGEPAVYGVDTGFGKLDSVRIAPRDAATLQRNLILSHCCGVGEAIEAPTVRLIMALKLLSLGRGASGVRPQTIELIEALIAKGVTPVIPSQGSVGASGDLAPLAQFAAVLIGEGRATFAGREMSGGEALAAAGLTPIALADLFDGLRAARIMWIGLGERHRAGLAFNEMARNGELKAPIVIGRDHLDAGSVASPNRETEAMSDGSDAASDWPLFNAPPNGASGATWVSLHHDGSVGMGFSQHSAIVICCDGGEDADRRIERVLWNDPAPGVMRHADAGYEIALDCAREHHLDVPAVLK